jgi:hypothetical protein
MKHFMVFGLILIALASCKNKVTGPSNTPSNDYPLITAGSLLDPSSIDLDNPGSVAEALVAEMAEEDSSLKGLSQSVLNDFAGAERGAIAQLKAQLNLPQKTSRAGGDRWTSFHKTGESPRVSLGRSIGALSHVIEDAGKNTISTCSSFQGGVKCEIVTEGKGGIIASITETYTYITSGHESKFMVKSTIDGNTCPLPDGKVIFDYSITYGTKTFQKSSNGTVTAQVDNLAFITESDITGDLKFEEFDTVTETSRKSYFFSMDQAISGGWIKGGSARIIKSNVVANHVDTYVPQTSISRIMQNADDYIQATLIRLMHDWRNGKCVTVITDAPEKVKPGSAAWINVSTTPDGLPVDVTLTGKSRVDPAWIDPISGKTKYTAPPDRGSSAILTFTSTSNRGIGRAVVNIRVEPAAYQAFGTGSNGMIISGNVPDFSVHFVLPGNSDTGGSGFFYYYPSSDSTGTVNGSFTGFGFTTTDSGTYTITGDRSGSGPLVLHQETYGCIEELPDFCGNNSADIILTPAQ